MKKKMFLKGTEILKQPTMDIDLAHRKVTFDNFDNNIENESIIDNKVAMLANEVISFYNLIMRHNKLLDVCIFIILTVNYWRYMLEIINTCALGISLNFNSN